jgi:hypothetical protein
MVRDRLAQLWRLIQRAMQQKLVRQLLYILIVLLSLAFIGYAIIVNWSELKNQEWHVNVTYVILVMVLYPLGMFPTVAAWHWLLRALGTRKPFWLNLRLYALSSLPRHIPGLVWYVTSRTLLYQEQGVGAGVVLVATAAETALLALSGFVSATLYFALQTDILSQFTALRIMVPIAAVVLASLLVLAPGGTRMLERFLRRWQKDGESVQFQRSALWACLGWMFLAWGGGGGLLWILVRAIAPIDWSLLPVMVGIWGAAGAVSLTIGIGIQGMGLREITLGAMLSTIISPLAALVVAVAFRLALMIGEFLWVFLIAGLTNRKTSQPKGIDRTQ